MTLGGRTVASAIAVLGLVSSGNAQEFGAGPYRYDTARAAGCMCEVDRARIAERIDQHRRPFAKDAVRSQSVSPLPFAFVPMAGTLYGDVMPVNYVDLDPTGGLRDFSCHSPAITYEGHEGIDLSIRSFGFQDVGVPIFAIADGVVIDTNDGNPDRSTELTEKPANFVLIDHGDDVIVAYYHMRSGSVAVSMNEEVHAGQQIGLVASSGYSSAPHLHLGVYIQGQPYEPFAGACRTGESGWVDQPSLDLTTRLWDVGVTPLDISTYPQWPEPLPVGGQLGVEDGAIYVWVQLQNLPVGSVHRLRFERPDGTVSYDYGPVSFGNEEFFPDSWWWWYFSLSDLQTITGTWHVAIEVNGTQVVRAPFEVLTSRSAAVNRAPAAVTLSFDPPAPNTSDVLFCRVNAPTLDDPDYDLVRYTYVWRARGSEVRRVTSASFSDAFALSTLGGGTTVTCTVTPSDGVASGSTIAATVDVVNAEINEDTAAVDSDNTNDNAAIDNENSNDNTASDNTDSADPNDNDNSTVNDESETEFEDVRADTAEPWSPPPAAAPQPCGAGMIGIWTVFLGLGLVRFRRS